MGDLLAGDQNSVWSRYLNDRETVWRVFKEFRDRNDPVTLRFDAVDTVYTARVRDVDHRRVTLDAIVPRSGAILMDSGRTFLLAGRYDGGYVYASDIERVGTLSAEAGAAVQFELPAQLLWQQRRRGAHYPVPASLRAGRARITLTQGRQDLSGVIEDLSSSGCRATFAASGSELLTHHDTFDHVQLEIAGLLSIRVRVAIRHRTVDPQTGAVTCGLEFTKIASDDGARLEQFLRSLARRAGQA